MTLPIRGRCWNCASPLTAADYGREQRCPGCDRATRVCLNCRHYAPGRPNACAEPLVEAVVDKDRSNFCERFDPSADAPERRRRSADPTELRAAAEALFKR